MNVIFEPRFVAKYSPKSMMEHLVRGADGTLYFDRNRCVVTPDEQRAFYYFMSTRYKMPWKSVEDLTVYFDIDGEDIIGGCYNIKLQRRVSERRLISAHRPATYTYTEALTEELKTIIKNA